MSDGATIGKDGRTIMAALYRGPLNLQDAMAVPALLHVTFAAIAALLVRMRAEVPKGHGRRTRPRACPGDC